MKKYFFILLLAFLMVSCLKEEQPNFKELPWEPVETGGIGANASSDVSALTDNRLMTYYQADVNENGVVEVVVPCSEDNIVAYTLVSSGVAEQTDAGVVTDSDPVAWTVSGSNDGSTWTQVASESDIAFFARFQKHIYYLDAPASYSQYKFEFTPKGGENVALSDIIFHAEDPYADWHDFTPPTITFVDMAGDEGSELYNVLVQDKDEYLKWHAREVCTFLYHNDQEERLNITNIAYYIEDFDGVSYKAGSAPNVQIHYSTQWIMTSAGESLLQLDLETRGVLFHEMTHAFQREPQGIPPYQEPNTSWQAIEGMADAVRTLAGYHDYSTRSVNGSVQSGYQTTGFFLYWLTKSAEGNPDAVRLVNESMKELDVWSWDEAFQYALEDDSVTAQSLWALYRVDGENYQSSDVNFTRNH